VVAGRSCQVCRPRWRGDHVGLAWLAAKAAVFVVRDRLATCRRVSGGQAGMSRLPDTRRGRVGSAEQAREQLEAFVVRAALRGV
jgi:hypothetical protein